jgi:hypothetical protein
MRRDFLGARQDAVRGDNAGAENDHEPPAEQRPDDVGKVIVNRRLLRRRLECSLLAQNVRVQLLQRRTRVDSELLRERRARLVIGLERLGLTARAVEGEHQLATKPLAERKLPDERLDLGCQLSALAERKVGFDPLLDGVQPKLFQPADLRLGKRLEGEVGERRAAPERKRLT